MASGEEEYSRQRACCDAWLAFADAKGIDWTVNGQSQVMKCSYLYGYEQENEMVFKMINHQKALKNGREKLKEKMIEATRRYNEQNGAILDLDKLIKM